MGWWVCCSCIAAPPETFGEPVAVGEQDVPPRSKEAQDDSTHAVVYPGGTSG